MMGWVKKPLSDVLGRIVSRKQFLTKTVNRKNACYFKLGDSEYFDVKCTDENLIEMKYKLTGVNYHINYDMKNDSASYYVTTRYSGHWKFSAPHDIETYTKLRFASTEEGYFQQMTRQDLTELPLESIVSLIDFVDAVYTLTEKARNGSETGT